MNSKHKINSPYSPLCPRGKLTVAIAVLVLPHALMRVASAQGAATPSSPTAVPLLPSVVPDAPVTPPTEPAPVGLTLDQAIGIALHTQGDVGAAGQTYVGAREGVTSARSNLYPSATANLDYAYHNNNGSSSGNSGGGGGGSSNGSGTNIYSTTTSNVSVSENLFDGGRTRAQIQQAQARARNAVGGVGSARSGLAYTVATNFYEQLREERLINQRRGQVALAQQQLVEILAEVDAGTAARSDTQSVQVNLSQASLDLSTAVTAAHVAQTRLRDSLGLGRGPALVLRDSDEARSLAPVATTPANLGAASSTAPAAPAATPDRPLPFTVITALPAPIVPNLAPLDSYTAEARRLRPDLLAALSNVQVNEAAVKLAKIQSQPQISATAGYNIDPRNAADRGFTFGAGISIPLFDAGGRRADVRASQANLSATQLHLSQLTKDAEADVEAAYVDIAGQIDTIANARALVLAAQVNLQTATEKYRAGLGIVLDIVNAQTQLFNAQTSATQTVYNYELSKSNLDRAVGRFAWTDPGQAPPANAPTTLPIQAIRTK